MTSGAIPGDGNAGTRIVPCREVISTQSPCRTPSLSAVCVLISTQLLHTADRLGVRQGDWVEITSRQGTIRVPAFPSPGIAPDVVAMPTGQGHENFTRYATGRGANPISILAPVVESETGTLAWAATRVKIRRVADADGSLVLFAGSLREYPPERPHR